MIGMATPPKKKGRPPKHESDEPGRSGQAVHVYIDPVLMAAFEAYRSSMKFKPRKTEILEMALRAFLTSEGFWPPKKV